MFKRSNGVVGEKLNREIKKDTMERVKRVRKTKEEIAKSDKERERKGERGRSKLYTIN